MKEYCSITQDLPRDLELRKQVPHTDFSFKMVDCQWVRHCCTQYPHINVVVRGISNQQKPVPSQTMVTINARSRKHRIILKQNS